MEIPLDEGYGFMSIGNMVCHIGFHHQDHSYLQGKGSPNPPLYGLDDGILYLVHQV